MCNTHQSARQCTESKERINLNVVDAFYSYIWLGKGHAHTTAKTADVNSLKMPLENCKDWRSCLHTRSVLLFFLFNERGLVFSSFECAHTVSFNVD